MDQGHLARRAANFSALSPVSFLERAAQADPDRVAVVHGSLRRGWGEHAARCRALGAALRGRGVGRGEVVSTLLPNIPAMLEAHHGVPMAGAVLHAINTRLDAAVIAFQLDHAGSRVLLVDREFAGLARAALELAQVRPLVVAVEDALAPEGEVFGDLGYEDLLAEGDPGAGWLPPGDEWDAIALNYTSGTTGNPKGVVYHHRGAALMAYANAVHFGLGRHPVLLWTLPMFHCNGWCLPWTIPLVAGTHVCLRAVRPGPVWDALEAERVTHLCGAPIVLSTVVGAAERRDLGRRVSFTVAGAPPPAAMLAAADAAGFDVVHVYGLTETYGPAVVNEWRPAFDALPADDRAALKSRQGMRYSVTEALAVLDPETLAPVAADGQAMGEVMFRGNNVMKGYHANPDATEEAFAGGWFRSGDLAVIHPDGQIQIRDRSKDIIISGGENISSIEVEDALYAHPAVAVCAVVARAHPKWGETPVAFVELKPGAEATREGLIAHARGRLAHYKCPTDVVFGEIPKTSTGKVQKFALRGR